jgi:transcriptional regulator with XRE-family HTH domain
MNIDMKTVGQRIKERRKQLHLTQMDLYNICNITSGALSNIENGLRTPSVTIFYSIAEALQCDMHYLLTGKPYNQDNSKFCQSEEPSTERYLLELFRTLSENDQEEIIMIAQLKHTRTQKTRGNKLPNFSGSENKSNDNSLVMGKN